MMIFLAIMISALIAGVASYFFGSQALLITLPLAFIFGLWAGFAQYRRNIK